MAFPKGPNANIVLQWLKDSCSWIGPDNIQIVKRDDEGMDLQLRIFTETHRYHISAHPQLTAEGRSYLGCMASCRKPRAGEEHHRGNDLPDGPLDEETFRAIMFAIVGYELVKLDIQPGGVVGQGIETPAHG